MGEPGPKTADEAAALRATLGRIVALMLEVIAGRRPAGQLASVAEARVRRYLQRRGRGESSRRVVAVALEGITSLDEFGEDDA